MRSVKRRYITPVEPAPTLVAPDVFRFLNVERHCSTAANWQPADAERLWVFNLHYFDDLNAQNATMRTAWHLRLLERWVVENPPGRGDAWEPYPVSRRIVNWVKWALRGNAFSPACLASLAVQSRWLLSRLEYRLLGNHLLANAKALVYAGLYFDGPEAQRWYDRGVNILDRQLPEQVLADGGHFELSPMYHAAVLEDLLDLVNVLGVYGREPPPGWLDCIARMQRWLRIMSHPDGEIAFFNDAAFGISPVSAELIGYATRLGLATTVPAQVDEPLVVLDASGYVRAHRGAAYLICDCAGVGPSYQPGHAHADTLSFELSLSEQRILVNSGTSQYGEDAERQRQRATAAHNTVVVDDMNSTEVWAGFRVARRAHARLHSAQMNDASVTIAASHDGYRRLPGLNEHRRRWTLDERSLSIEDEISGSFRSAVGYFHLHPNVQVRELDAREVTLVLPGGAKLRMVFQGAASVRLSAGTWHPQFGMAVANHCIAAHFASSSLSTRLSWASPP